MFVDTILTSVGECNRNHKRIIQTLMEAMVELKSEGSTRTSGGKSSAIGKTKSVGKTKSAPLGTSLDSKTGRPMPTGSVLTTQDDSDDSQADLRVPTIDEAVATIGLACQTLAHDAATSPHEFCGWTDTTPLVRAAMATASFVMSILAAAILTGSVGEVGE